MRAKAKGQHAHVIEKRNDLLRLQYNRIRFTARNEGLRVTSEQILDEALLACNALLSVHGATPYEAVFGRVPNLLRDIGSGGPALDDLSGGSTSKRIHRLREISPAQIIQGHAEARLKAAERSRTRPAIQLLDLKPGDMVEFHRDPPGKDVSGWRGPGGCLNR